MKEILNQMFDFVTEKIGRGTMGVTMVYETEPKIRKGRSAGNRTESYKRFYDQSKDCWNVRVVTTANYLTIGVSYENGVNNHIVRDGGEPVFKSDKPKGKTYVHYPYFLKKDDDENTLYFAVYPTKKTKYERTYYVDGRLATDEEKRVIENDLSEPNGNNYAKQYAYGIKRGNEKKYFSVTLTNIIEIRQGMEKILKLK